MANEENKAVETETPVFEISLSGSKSPSFGKKQEQIGEAATSSVPYGFGKKTAPSDHFGIDYLTNGNRSEMAPTTTPSTFVEMIKYKNAFSTKRVTIGDPKSFEEDLAYVIATEGQSMKWLGEVLRDASILTEVGEAIFPQNVSKIVRKQTQFIFYFKLHERIVEILGKKRSRMSKAERSSVAAILIELIGQITGHSGFIRRIKPIQRMSRCNGFTPDSIDEILTMFRMEELRQSFGTFDQSLGFSSNDDFIERNIYIEAIIRVFSVLGIEISEIVKKEKMVKDAMSVLCWYMHRDQVKGFPERYINHSSLLAMARNATLCRIAMKYGIRQVSTDTSGWGFALDTTNKLVMQCGEIEVIPLSTLLKHVGHEHFKGKGGMVLGTLAYTNMPGSDKFEVYKSYPFTEDEDIVTFDDIDPLFDVYRALTAPIMKKSIRDYLIPVSALTQEHTLRQYRAVIDEMDGKGKGLKECMEEISKHHLYRMALDRTMAWYYACALAVNVYPVIRRDQVRTFLFAVNPVANLGTTLSQSLEGAIFTQDPYLVIMNAAENAAEETLPVRTDGLVGDINTSTYMADSVECLEGINTTPIKFEVQVAGKIYRFQDAKNFSEMVGENFAEKLSALVPVRTHFVMHNAIHILTTMYDTAMLGAKTGFEGEDLKCGIATVLKDMLCEIADTPMGRDLIEGLKYRTISDDDGNMFQHVLQMSDLSRTIATLQMRIFLGLIVLREMNIIDGDIYKKILAIFEDTKTIAYAAYE